MVEFDLEFDKPEGQRILSPPEGRIFITNLPGEDAESKQYVTPDNLEPTELSTYIDLMIVNLKRLKTQAKKRLSAYRRQSR
jgi:hypothetical protein